MVVNVAGILPQELTLWQVGSRLKQMDFQKRKNKESVSECHRSSSLSRQMAASKPASVKLVWNKEVFFGLVQITEQSGTARVLVGLHFYSVLFPLPGMALKGGETPSKSACSAPL